MKYAKLKLLEIRREKLLRKARINFWTYCRVLAPDFYLPHRTHLKELCDTLQAFWENRLLKPDGMPYDKLMINYPPRHGKSRTLILFETWVFGQSIQNMAMTLSFNDESAQDFSKYTRNEIQKTKNVPNEIIFSDIFPKVKVKRGDSSYKRWALEGHFFNYLGSGLDGTMTGKGFTLGVVDDPIKNSKVAYNEKALNDIWQIISETFLSRQEQGSKIILNLTRWATGDPCGRLLGEYKKMIEVAQPDEWYILKKEVIENGKMLCPDLLDKKTYLDIKKLMRNSPVFQANYHQRPVDIKGKLYKGFQTYKAIPVNEHGEIDFDYVAGYTDTADMGNDFLCSIIAGVRRKGDKVYRYVLDIAYTDKPMEITEPLVASMILKVYNKWGFPVNMTIESNNGGRGFARNVERLVKKQNSKALKMKWFHQSENKRARILTNATDCLNYLYMVDDWENIHKEYYLAMTDYNSEGDNEHDDAPDCTTGLIEITDKRKSARAGRSLA